MQMSSLCEKRLSFIPKIPKIFQNHKKVLLNVTDLQEPKVDKEKILKKFPNTFSQPLIEFKNVGEDQKLKTLKIGVVFSGGQAAGGHNVITALFDAIKAFNSNSSLLGFLNGPIGIVENKTMEITKEILSKYRNQGGFDLIGSGRTKIETDDQLKASKNTAEKLDLDGIVIIGGDDSNTNAAVLAEYFKRENVKTAIVGVPKTIDGDLRNDFVEISFGFDTACKVYSELIGNIARDSLSAKKYYHFIRLMGRSASHIALECALKTQPNYVVIAEEVLEKKKTLKDIAKEITEIIIKRAENKKNYGVFLIPEGLIEFIPEIKELIKELNIFLAKNSKIENFSKISEKVDFIIKHLSDHSGKCLKSFPEKIQEQLLLDRDPHGNVQVSLIETEKLILDMVKKELLEKRSKISLKALCHFFGYEGRASLPTNFDAEYCYSLGLCAAHLINNNLSGYMACVNNLNDCTENWKIFGLPITMFFNMEVRKGVEKPVIKKALVDLKSHTFLKFLEIRKSWQIDDKFIYPGPIQYFGDLDLTDSIPQTISPL